MRTLPLKANHKRIAAYRLSLAELEKLGMKAARSSGRGC
jgi:hypothetical protein